MCIYFVVEVIILFIVFISYRKTTKINNGYFAIACLLWVIVFGFRGYNVGNDTSEYAAFFDGRGTPGVGYGIVDAPGDTIEIGFVIFSKIIHSFSSSPTFFFLIVATLLFVGIFTIYSRFSKNPTWALLIFFVIANNFNTLMVAMRQAVSISLLLLGLSLLVAHFNIQGYNDIKKNNGVFRKGWRLVFALLLIIWSMATHRTSIMIFPVLLLLLYIHIGKKNATILITASMVICLILPQFIGAFFDIVLANIGMIDTEEIALLGDRYQQNFGETSTSLIRLLAWYIPALFTIVFTEKKVVGTFCFNSYVLSVVLFLTLNSSLMVTRLNVVFSLIGMNAFIPYKVNKDRRIFVLYMLITLYYLWRAYAGFEKWPSAEDSSLPYKFFWE